MTVKTEDYTTRAKMQAGKDRHVSNGFRATHTDFINNVEAQGYHVTYDDTPPTPRPPNRQLTQQQFIEELATQRSVTLI